MISISTTFTRAATGKTDTDPVFSTFWMLVWAIAIDDDRQRREKERRRKREQAQQPRKPKPPPGPR